MTRLSVLSVPRLMALAGLGSAVFAGSQEQWVLGGTALGVGLGALALRRKPSGIGEELFVGETASPRRVLLQDKLAAELASDRIRARFGQDSIILGRSLPS